MPSVVFPQYNWWAFNLNGEFRSNFDTDLQKPMPNDQKTITYV